MTFGVGDVDQLLELVPELAGVLELRLRVLRLEEAVEKGDYVAVDLFEWAVF